MRNILCSGRVVAGLAAGVLVMALLAEPAAATSGAEVWARLYTNTASSGPDYGNDLATSQDGRMVVSVGESNDLSSQVDYVTIAYNAATGARFWTRRYNGPDNDIDRAYGVAISPDSNIIAVTGLSHSKTSNDDALTIAYDAKGNVLWRARFNGAANGIDFARDIGFTPDGKLVIIAGKTDAGTTGTDALTVAYEATSGHMAWSRRYNGPASALDEFNALSVAPDGSAVVVTGGSDGTSGTKPSDFITIAYEPTTGKALWFKRYNGTGNSYDEAWAVKTATGTNDVAIVCGESAGPALDYDYVASAYDLSSGTLLWNRRYAGSGKSRDGCYGLDISPDTATVVVNGASLEATQDFTTLAYDVATGTRLWLKRFDGYAHGFDFGNFAAFTPDGTHVVVSGGSRSAKNGVDILTIKYETATGARSWFSRYDDPEHRDDYGYGLSVLPDGLHAAVQGTSGPGSDAAVATIVYEV